ncbi:hypothetical protein LCGC14_1937160 [marine sediment metagenome]|uniref:Uncharacterized protein n=1 Tax=marine sediment metagenome TaxID=412755 RepID=A0A0F9FLN0_9ZZZZ
MASPIERLRNMSRMRKSALDKASTIVQKMKDQATAAERTGKQIRETKE